MNKGYQIVYEENNTKTKTIKQLEKIDAANLEKINYNNFDYIENLLDKNVKGFSTKINQMQQDCLFIRNQFVINFML